MRTTLGSLALVLFAIFAVNAFACPADDMISNNKTTVVNIANGIFGSTGGTQTADAGGSTATR